MSDKSWEEATNTATVVACITFASAFLQKAVDYYSGFLPDAQLVLARKCIYETGALLATLDEGDKAAVREHNDGTCKAVEVLETDWKRLVLQYSRVSKSCRNTGFLIKKLAYVSTLASQVQQVLRDAERTNDDTINSTNLARKHNPTDDTSSTPRPSLNMPKGLLEALQADLEIDLAELGLDTI